MRIHTYIQLSCIILIDIVVHYDYSISIYICSNLRLPKKFTAGFHRFFNGSNCQSSSVDNSLFGTWFEGAAGGVRTRAFTSDRRTPRAHPCYLWLCLCHVSAPRRTAS